MMILKRPKASVCIISYNQEKYIEKCIQSVLNQSAKFDFEIIVGDDASTDGTRRIISELEKHYPEIIKSVFHTNNVGPTKNHSYIHSIARGDYVAHLDGDDFALPDKLAKQVHYLENNLDCIAVVHRLKIIDKNGRSMNSSWPKKFHRSKYTMRDLTRFHPEFGPSSLMYRNGAYQGFLEHADGEIIDLYGHIHLTSQGNIGVIDETLGLYTKGVGISTGRDLCDFAIRALDYGRLMGMKETDYRHGTARQYLLFAKQAFVRGDRESFVKRISESYQASILSISQIMLFWFFKNRRSFKVGHRVYLGLFYGFNRIKAFFLK